MHATETTIHIRTCSHIFPNQPLQGCQHIHGVGPDAVVGVGFGEGDGVVLPDDEGRRKRETPALIAIDKRNVDKDGAIMQPQRLGNRVGNPELGGEEGAGVGQHGEAEPVALDGKVVLPYKLRRNRDQQRTAFAELRVEDLPGFELRHAVRAPAAAEELDDERPKGEEVAGADGFAAGVLELEGGRGRADVEDRALNAGGEQVVDGVVGDGKALGLDEFAGVRGDEVELVLETHRTECRG